MSRIEKRACKKFEDDSDDGSVQFVQSVQKSTQEKPTGKRTSLHFISIIHNTLFTYLSPFSCEEYSLA